MTDERYAQPGPRQRRSWIPGVLGDRYDVDRELGSGAAAVTVAAQDRRLGRRVAIKILKPESEIDPEFSKRFAREARVAASINHPNVVSVYDVGQDGDLLYLVMQFVDGIDLKHLIDREGVLPWRRAVSIARDVLAGLVPIHDTGIVHRDIKPQNVLIGDDGTVKVTDFGVAHVDLDSELTTAGMTVGTASYMAPEQAQGQTPTPAADVYAVGIMLYEMVSGRLPFTAPTSVATMLAHIQQTAEDPRAPAGMEAIPEGLTLVIRQAMAKEPGARFRSAGAMRRALEHPASWQSSQATVATPLAGDRTQIVQPVRREPRRPPQRHVATSPVAQRRARPHDADQERAGGGGFGTVFVTFLVVLALGLVATAGVLWFLEQQDGGNSPANQNMQPPATTQVPTPSPTDESEAPGLIEPIEDEPEPTATTAPTQTTAPTPTDAPTPTETPTPTEEVIVPPEETPTPTTEPTAPPIEPNDGEVIEPIGGETVESDPQE